MIEKALRETLKYVPQFRDKIIVISIGSKVFENMKLSELMTDISVLSSLNIKTIITFSISEYSDDKLNNYVSPYSIDSDTLRKISTECMDKVNKILSSLSDSKLVGLLGNFIVANPVGISNGKDMGFFGKVDKILTNNILNLISKNVIIFPPIGFSRSNQMLYLNYFDLATSLAVSLNAIKIIFLEDDNYFKKYFSLRQIVVNDAKLILKNPENLNIITEQRLRLSIKACTNGVERIQFLEHTQSNIILTELFSNKGVGYMIYSDNYENIRPAKSNEANEILNLIKSVNEEGEILERDFVNILENISDYFVIDIDGNIIGCIALHKYKLDVKGEDKLISELACLCVHHNFENLGYGETLCKFVENLAKEINSKYIFTLTTRAQNFFIQKFNYKESSDKLLPNKRKKLAQESKRNSKILVKYL